jgi:hypothetical protein
VAGGRQLSATIDETAGTLRFEMPDMAKAGVVTIDDPAL